jgi:hypothetical protein
MHYFLKSEILAVKRDSGIDVPQDIANLHGSHVHFLPANYCARPGRQTAAFAKPAGKTIRQPLNRYLAASCCTKLD